MSDSYPPPIPARKPSVPATTAVDSNQSRRPIRANTAFANALDQAAAPPLPQQKPLAAALASLGAATPPVPQPKPLAAALVASGFPVPPTPTTKPPVPGPQSTGLASAAPSPTPAVAPVIATPVQTTSDSASAVKAPPVPRAKPAVPEPAENPYESAARSISQFTKVSYQDIMARAAQESDFNAASRSRASSAAGPFQFLEKTWLTMLHKHGAAYGLGPEIRQIEMHGGVPQVRDPAVRKRLLDLRHDIPLSAGMAARYLDEVGQDLGKLINRKPSETERRMAYFLGPGGAAKLIRAASHDPGGSAVSLLPEAARSNRTLFYSGGQALSNAAALGKISHFMSRYLDHFDDRTEPAPLSTDINASSDTTG